MIWILVIIVVFVIYNAEHLPEMANKLKKEMPHIVDAGKKATKELKEKAQTIHQEKVAKKAKSTTQKEPDEETSSTEN